MNFLLVPNNIEKSKLKLNQQKSTLEQTHVHAPESEHGKQNTDTSQILAFESTLKIVDYIALLSGCRNHTL